MKNGQTEFRIFFNVPEKKKKMNLTVLDCQQAPSPQSKSKWKKKYTLLSLLKDGANSSVWVPLNGNQREIS